MPTIKQGISQISSTDKEFIGTVAFRNEKLSLPDGSKVAIGIDGDRWVIVYQKAPKSPFVMYEYSANKKSVLVDKHMGGPEEMQVVKNIVSYFFENAQVDDLVTIEPGGEQA